MKGSPLTAELLRAAVTYDPLTGEFRRLVSSSHAKAGDAADCVNARGYIEFNVLGRLHRAHRLAWLYVYGEWPAGDIDHKNRDKTDNRIANLRVVTNRVNSENRSDANSNSSTGLLGVRRRRNGTFEARIGVGGHLLYLGVHVTAEQAHAAYLSAKRINHLGSII